MVHCILYIDTTTFILHCIVGMWRNIQTNPWNSMIRIRDKIVKKQIMITYTI